MAENNILLEMKHIGKSFGGTRALNDVSVTIKKGEVVGLIGENGAGKSTLMKILCGAHNTYDGEIWMEGRRIELKSPAQAADYGIGIIYQELTVFTHMNVAQNIFISNELGGKNPLMPMKDREMHKRAAKVLKEELGLDIDTHTLVSELGLAQREMVEIARCLIQKKKIVIMDEPTASLETRERELLFQIIRKLKEGGCTVIYISHYLEEILNVCDRAVVLRDGVLQADRATSELTINKIIELMIGDSLEKQYPKEDCEFGDVVLKVENLTKKKAFQNINMEIHAGEVVGIAGLVSSGKNELVRSIMGITGYDSGNIQVHGKDLQIKSVADAVKQKFAFIPAERKTEAIFAIQDVAWNTTIASLKQLNPRALNKKKEEGVTKQYIEELRTKVSGTRQAIQDLSGGNQQKVILARWLMTEPEIILMEEPTRGIDVKAKVDVYRLINECAKKGKAICVVSGENAELLGICDKIIVLHDGVIRAVVDSKECTQEQLTYYTQTKGEEE